MAYGNGAETTSSSLSVFDIVMARKALEEKQDDVVASFGNSTNAWQQYGVEIDPPDITTEERWRSMKVSQLESLVIKVSKSSSQTLLHPPKPRWGNSCSLYLHAYSGMVQNEVLKNFSDCILATIPIKDRIDTLYRTHEARFMEEIAASVVDKVVHAEEEATVGSKRHEPEQPQRQMEEKTAARSIVGEQENGEQVTIITPNKVVKSPVSVRKPTPKKAKPPTIKVNNTDGSEETAV